MIEIGGFRPRRLRRWMNPYQRLVARTFHQLYYRSWRHGIQRGPSPDTLRVHWFGYEMIKCPFDLWTYQEILVERRPDWVIECGTFRGGTALYLASLMDLIGHGRVITIDVVEHDGRPSHPRIRYLTGSSTAPDVVAEVRRSVAPGERCFVILDSDHTKNHVLDELRRYSDLIAVDDYIIVEDSNVNGHPAYRKHGPGPMEAIQEFLREDDRFVPDPGMERFLLTMNPSGYLRRVK